MDGTVGSKEGHKTPPAQQKFSDDGTYTFFWLVTVRAHAPGNIFNIDNSTFWFLPRLSVCAIYGLSH